MQHSRILRGVAALITSPKSLPKNASLRQVLAHNLRLLRFELQLSQEDLALQRGLDRTYVSAVERCVWNVSLANVEKLAGELGVEPWQLLHPRCGRA